MRRIGMTIGIKVETLDEYVRIHENVPPHVLGAMQKANVRNFSIFHHDDRLFGYLEYHGDDFEADMQRMGADPAMEDWWAITTEMQFLLPGSSDVYAWTPMEEVFYME